MTSMLLHMHMWSHLNHIETLWGNFPILQMWKLDLRPHECWKSCRISGRVWKRRHFLPSIRPLPPPHIMGLRLRTATHSPGHIASMTASGFELGLYLNLVWTWQSVDVKVPMLTTSREILSQTSGSFPAPSQAPWVPVPHQHPQPWSSARWCVWGMGGWQRTYQVLPFYSMVSNWKDDFYIKNIDIVMQNSRITWISKMKHEILMKCLACSCQFGLQPTPV